MASAITVSLLCTKDGFPIVFSINSEKEGGHGIDLLTAMIAAVHSTSRRAIAELEAGPHRTTIIEGGKGSFLIKEISDEVIFCCHIPKSKDALGPRVRTYMIGVALSTMEKTAAKIKKYLDKCQRDLSE